METQGRFFSPSQVETGQLKIFDHQILDLEHFLTIQIKT